MSIFRALRWGLWLLFLAVLGACKPKPMPTPPMWTDGHAPTATPSPTPTPPCVPPPSDLVAWWPLDETSGTTAQDLAGFPNNLSLTGNSVAVAGMVGGARQFNAGASPGQGVTPPQADLDVGTGNFTIEGWVSRWDTFSNISWVINKRDANTKVGYELIIANGMLDIAKSGTNSYPPPGIPIASSQWKHFAVVVDRTANVV